MIQDEHEQIILQSFFDGLRPIPRMTVSQWANNYRILNTKSSAEPGPYRYERTPYLRKVMDYLGFTSDVQEVVVMKGVQTGFTDAGNNWIGHTMHIDPGPAMIVMPTIELLKKNSRTRLEPMIESTPVLKELTGKKGEKGTVNTILEKEFPGGFLLMVAAQSPTGLSSTPVGKLFLDEVDRFPQSSGEEGSPVELAKARTTTFSNRKIYMVSTPTTKGTSLIEKEFETGNKECYHVPCLGCGDLFVITWNCITWEEGKPETTRCACPACGFLHEERHKTKMFAEKGFSEDGRAEWIATAVSEDSKKVSMHLSGLYSPAGWQTWEKSVRMYLKALDDVNKMISFTNLIKGQTYEVDSEKIDHDNLFNRREGYKIGTVPEEVCLITMGADIQRDRIECEIVGWCKDKISYSIDYLVIHGDTTSADNEVWQKLRDAINKQYPRHDDYTMNIKLTCVDSGDGTSTKQVYDFCSSMGNDRVIPIKGMDKLDVMVTIPKTINVSRSGKKIGSSKVWGVGVSLIKSELFGFLKLKARQTDEGFLIYPPGYCHFPMYGENYFKMLTAESLEKVTDSKKKTVSYQWVKKQERNEALDCRVYARAAAFLVGVDKFEDKHWERMKELSKKIPDVIKAPAKKSKKKSSFWDR